MARVLLTDNMVADAAKVFDRYDGVETVCVGTLPPDELKKTIGGFDAVVVRSPTKLTADVFEAAAPGLRYVGRAGAGTDNIDLAAAKRHGVVVMNSPGGNTVSTAEHTIGLLLALVRHIPQAHASLVGGKWDRKVYEGSELGGKTLGIIGLGRVGGAVARRMTVFGMNVLAFDTHVGPDAGRETGAEMVDMDTLLGRSHVVTVHVPLNDDTRGLLNESEFSRMRQGAFLVNCSRGGVVSENALRGALDSGRLAGVALDVYEDEPPGDHPLFAHPRCVFTPHLAGATAEARVRVAVDAAEAVAVALDTGVTTNVVKIADSGA